MGLIKKSQRKKLASKKRKKKYRIEHKMKKQMFKSKKKKRKALALSTFNFLSRKASGGKGVESRQGKK